MIRSTPWKARRASPASTRERARWIAAPRAAHPEQRIVAERQRYDRRGKICLVLVLMQAHPRARRIVIDEARLRRTRIPGERRPRFEHHRRHRRPSDSRLRMGRLIAIAVDVGDPAERPAIRHPDREGFSAPRHARLVERRPGEDGAERREQRLLPGRIEIARNVAGAPYIHGFRRLKRQKPTGRSPAISRSSGRYSKCMVS